MSTEIKAPTFPESVADGTIATWHKQPGEQSTPIVANQLKVATCQQQHLTENRAASVICRARIRASPSSALHWLLPIQHILLIDWRAMIVLRP